MKHYRILLAVVVGWPLLAAVAQSAEAELQRAIQTELARGCRAATADYERVIDRGNGSRTTAQALLRLANCLEQLGNDDRARATLERLARDFADQPEGTEARRRVRTALPASQAAAPFTSRDIEKYVVSDEYFGAIAPNISPDGKLVMFLRVHGTRTLIPAPEVSICVRDLSTGEDRAIAGPLRGDRPWTSWSDDGRRLAVSLRIATKDTTRREIVVASVEPGGPPPITLPSIAGTYDDVYGVFQGWLVMSWSPDGRHVSHVATTTDSQLEARLLDVTTGQTRSLGILPHAGFDRPLFSPGNAPPSFHWSPDGREVTLRVADPASGAHRIRRIDLGTNETRIIDIPAAPNAPVRVIRRTTRGQLVFTAAGGSELAFSLLDLETGQAVVACEQRRPEGAQSGPGNVLSLRSSEADECLGVTPDGVHVLRWSAASQRVLIRNVASGEERPLTQGSGDERDPRLSPDGRMIVFVSNREGRWGLYAAPVAAAPVAAPVLIAMMDTLPSRMILRWTVDGFITDSTYWEGDVWRVDIDPKTARATAPPVRLTNEGQQNFLPAVSPDGKRIAYWSRHAYRMNLSVMDATGANERVARPTEQPTNHSYWAAPAWRGNEDVIFSTYAPAAVPNLSGRYRSGPGSWTQPGGGTRQFFTLNLGTFAATPLPVPELERAPVPARLDWQVLAARDEMVILQADATGRASFLVRPIAGGASRTLATLETPLDAVTGFLVSPDASRIAYATKGTWRVHDVAGKADVPYLGNFTAPAAWSPDGRHLLYNAGQPHVLETSSGKSWPLLEGGPRLNWSGDASWSSDGGFLTIWIPRIREEWRHWQGVTPEAIARLVR